MRITYTAHDGTTFDTESECLAYEASRAGYESFKRAVLKLEPHLRETPERGCAEAMAEDFDINGQWGCLYGALSDWGLEGIWWLREPIKQLAAIIDKAEAS